MGWCNLAMNSSLLQSHSNMFLPVGEGPLNAVNSAEHFIKTTFANIRGFEGPQIKIAISTQTNK